MSRLLPLALLLFFSVQDKDPLKLKWKIPKDHFVRYKGFTFLPAKPDKLYDSYPRAAGLFAYEIVGETKYAPDPRNIADAPLAFCFTLPSKPLAIGDSCPIEADFDAMPYGPFAVKGVTTRNANVEIQGVSCVELAHKAQVVPGKSAAMKSGTFEGVVHFDAALGVARRVRYAWTFAYESTDGTKTAHAQHEGLEFVRIVPPRYPQFEVDVSWAIDKGVEALWRRFDEKESHWPALGAHTVGPSALALLAIIKGTTDRKDPRIRRALDWILGQPLRHTYDVGISLMALEAFAAGGSVDKAQAIWAAQAAKWLAAEQLSNGMWSYPTEKTCDFSNTQYGVLGLLSAARLGVPAETSTITRAIRAYLETQEKNGPKVSVLRSDQHAKGTNSAENAKSRGWGYITADPVYASMTLGGIGSLTILDALMRRVGKSDPRIAGARRDGWAWMQTNWSVRANAGYGWGWYAYTMYGLERAAMLQGVHAIGGHDWYFEGAVVLISNQSSDGTWFGTTLQDTCFAVLFLRRATQSVGTGGK